MAMTAKRKGKSQYILCALVTVVTFLMSANMTVGKDGSCAYCFCGLVRNCEKDPCCHSFSVDLLTPLQLEVNCSRPHLSYIVDNPRTTPASGSQQCSGFLFKITSEQTCLTSLPKNLCDFPDIRAVILSGTSMTEIPDLSCLSNLEFLDLSRNKLRSVPRDAFSGLSMIMEIKLDYNQIEYIHPNAFDVSLPKLNRLSITNNRLVTVESWLILRNHPFCEFDFSFNRIEQISNTLHRTLDPDLQYGPGIVNVTHNSLTRSPVLFLKESGLFNQILLWSKFLNWNFDMRHNPFFCDCDFYEIQIWLKFLNTVIQRDIFNITCAAPPNFMGKRLIDLPPDDLKCDVTVNCPEKCKCLRRPEERDTSVNCNGSGLSELPLVMPEGNLTLLFVNNSLRGLRSREYLARTVNLNVSSNRIDFIEQEVPRLLMFTVKHIDLQNNSLRHLPKTFQVLTPGTVFLDPNTLSCTCDLDWFPSWAGQSATPRIDHVHCTTEQGHIVLLRNATRDDLGCDSSGGNTAVYKLSLISVAVVLVIVMVVMVVFRYEALVLGHAVRGRIKRRKSSVPSTDPSPHYDVFLSTAASDANVSWVSEVLLPLLGENGLTCYWPARDCLPGTVEMEEVTKKLHDSQSALVLLSYDYINSHACLFQFRQAYNWMMQHDQGRLILLLHGAFRRTSITEPRLRAMITLRMAHKSCRLETVNKVLGKLKLNTRGVTENIDIGRV